MAMQLDDIGLDRITDAAEKLFLVNGGEIRWLCDYPEFSDDGCLVYHNHNLARIPNKHLGCSWYMCIPWTAP